MREAPFGRKFQDPRDSQLAGHLMSVSLATYVLPAENLPPGTAEAAPSHVARTILDWADAILAPGNTTIPPQDPSVTEALQDATALGIPVRTLGGTPAHSSWSHPPDTRPAPRHGFGTKKELLDFLDARLGQPVN